MKDTILMQIANGLSTNVQKLTSPGLLEGKMGVAIYLYLYSGYSGYTGCKHFADNLIDEVITGISERDISIATGLSGIGWGINHLMKERFIQGEDNLLADFDECILQYIKDHSDENMPDGCIFLTFDHPKPLDEPIMQVFARQFPIFLSSAAYPLYILNKLLAVANCMLNKHLYPWYNMLLNAAVYAIHTKEYHHSDLVICRDLLEAFPGKKDNQPWRELYDCCSSGLSTGISYTDHLETVWQKRVFLGGATEVQHDMNQISMYVAHKLKDLHTQDMFFSVGLPAVGMNIILASQSAL